MKPQYWSGSEESWDAYQASLKKMEEYQARGGRADEIEVPNLYQRQGNVGTISISGSLVSGRTSPLYQYFGIVGYENIKAAILEGVKDKGADKLMLIGNSGGGAVDGCSDCAEFIRAAASVKPMNAHANFTASACYWLISAAPHITLSDTGIAGSIGIIRIHTEYSQADKKEGITRTVLRAGENKARMNPYEPLTKEVLAAEQKKMDYLHDRFISAVAHQRDTSKAVVKRDYGDGSTFIGTMALDVGLVDAVGDMSAALAYAKSNTKKLESSKIKLAVTPAPANVPDNSAKLINGKTSMDEELPTAEELAALAGDAGEQADDKTPKDITVPDLSALQAQIGELTTAATAKDTQITDLTAQLTAATEAKTVAETALAEANTTIEALTPAVQASVKKLAVGLNKKVDVATLDSKTLASTYVEYSASYLELFKAGKVTKQTMKVGDKGEQTEQPKNVAAVDPMFALKAKSIK